MKDKHFPKSYDDFYDEIRDKYTLSGDGYWLQDKQQDRKVDSTRREYVKIVEIISHKTGFNTCAPVQFFEQAKKLSEKLSTELQDTKNEEANRELLRQANWALFEKHDFLEAQNLLNKIRIR